MQDEIKKALDVLYNGGVILYPTDTEWSLGCDATNDSVVSRVKEIAGELEFITVLIDNQGKLQSYVEEVPDMAWDLIEMSEKPLTIIYSGVRNLSQNILTKEKTVGIRVTNEAFSKNLCARFRKPIVAVPVAKGFFASIPDNVKIKADYVVNFRQTDRVQPKPASVIKLGKGNLFQLIQE
jgi:L-threonylcarbamoyladenylate synthase